jgi:hypothetical protein
LINCAQRHGIGANLMAYARPSQSANDLMGPPEVALAQPDAGRDAPDRGATATVARELESEIHGLLFFETLG